MLTVTFVINIQNLLIDGPLLFISKKSPRKNDFFEISLRQIRAKL